MFEIISYIETMLAVNDVITANVKYLTKSLDKAGNLLRGKNMHKNFDELPLQTSNVGKR